MTTWIRPLALTLFLLAGSLGLRCAFAAGWDAGQLMEALARHQGGRVSFVERKYIAVLDRPVESSGELVYRPPARLEKRTFKPKPESVVLDGDTLVVERGKQRHTLKLAQYPAAAAAVDSIRDTLAGNLQGLQRHYRVELEGGPQHWTVTLLPSDAEIAAIISRIRISGERDEVRQIETLQPDGDRSVMDIQRAQ